MEDFDFSTGGVRRGFFVGWGSEDGFFFPVQKSKMIYMSGLEDAVDYAWCI